MRSPASARPPPRCIIAEIGTGHDPLPHRRPPGVVGPVRARGVKESAGKKKGNGSTGHGNRYLARVLGEAAVAAGKTDTFLGERYRRIARRRGTEEGHRRRRPLHPGHRLAPARPTPTPGSNDLGSQTSRQPHQSRTARRVATSTSSEALGYKVTLEPAA